MAASHKVYNLESATFACGRAEGLIREIAEVLVARGQVDEIKMLGEAWQELSAVKRYLSEQLPWGEFTDPETMIVRIVGNGNGNRRDK